MALFKKNTYAPFDDIAKKTEVIQSDNAPVVSAQRDGYSFRGAVFTIACMVSLCWIFSYCESLIVSLASYGAYLLVWVFVLRFLERKSLVPLNLFLNVALAAVPCGIFHASIDANLFFALVPLALGVTVLGSCPTDGRQQFEWYPISRFAVNVVSVLVAGGLTELVFLPMQCGFLSPRIMVASIFMMLFPLAEEKLLGTHTLLSGRSLSGSAVLPKTEFSTLNTFVSGRLMFIGISLVAYAAALGLAFVCALYSDLDPSCVRALATALVFALTIAITKNTRMPFEAFIPILFYARTDTLTMFLLVAAADILIRGFITVTRRKSIFHMRNKYVDGIPAMLMTVAIFIMVAECCL